MRSDLEQKIWLADRWTDLFISMKPARSVWFPRQLKSDWKTPKPYNKPSTAGFTIRKHTRARQLMRIMKPSKTTENVFRSMFLAWGRDYVR